MRSRPVFHRHRSAWTTWLLATAIAAIPAARACADGTPAPTAAAAPQAASPTPAPTFAHLGGRVTLMVDGRPFVMLGGQMHNSSAWPDRMDAVWEAAKALGINTLGAPVYWERFEPSKGRFDFDGVDRLLWQARAHHVRLELLWFGTWKNGAMHYVPEWIKHDPARFPRLLDADGRPLDGLSPFGTATIEADGRAFATLMAHLRDRDGTAHTVIAVQVENEPGLLGTVRDHTATADAAFAGPVPAPVLAAMHAAGGTWRQAFGYNAAEDFAAWSVARDVQSVAEAGLAAYRLPLIVNDWMRGIEAQPGFDYPSGGATDNVLPIWRAVAPAIGVVGTDDYTDTLASFREREQPYTRPDNALFVSESALAPESARWIFQTLAGGGIGASQFGIDDPPSAARAAAWQAIGDNNRLLGPASAFLAEAAHDGRVRALLEQPGALEPETTFNGWRITAAFGASWGKSPPATAPLDHPALGRVLVVPLDATHVLVAGMSARVVFAPIGDEHGPDPFMERVEQGHFGPTGWVTDRILNGDETDYGVALDPHGTMVRVTLDRPVLAAVPTAPSGPPAPTNAAPG